MTESCAAMTAPRLASIASSQSAKNPSGLSATPSRDNSSYATTLRTVQHLRLTRTLLHGRLARPKLIGASVLPVASSVLGGAGVAVPLVREVVLVVEVRILVFVVEVV